MSENVFRQWTKLRGRSQPADKTGKGTATWKKHGTRETMQSERNRMEINSTRSSNFGGLWERNVRSFKDHLKRTLSNSRLTFEEYGTVLCQIEACLNSRPLCPLTNDDENLNALTPGHFLIGDALLAPPQPTLLDSTANSLDRWRHLQLLQQHFWTRWHHEYLRQLQQRQKWRQIERNLKIGDLVLIKEDNVPPRHWAMARIIETHPGKDGFIRVVTLRTQQGTTARPISKICLLYSEEDQKEDMDRQEFNLDNDSSDQDANNEVVKNQSKENQVNTNNQKLNVKTRSQTKKETRNQVNHSAQKQGESAKTTQKTSGYNLRPKMPKTFIMILAIFGLIVAANSSAIQKKPLDIEQLEQNPGIYFEDIGKVSPVKTNWHMYMYFSLGQYMYELKRLTDTVQELTNRCKEGDMEIH